MDSRRRERETRSLAVYLRGSSGNFAKLSLWPFPLSCSIRISLPNMALAVPSGGLVRPRTCMLAVLAGVVYKSGSPHPNREPRDWIT